VTGRRLALAAAVLVAAVLVARGATARLPELAAWVAGLGAWGPAAFIGLYAVATLLAVFPCAVFSVTAGAVFGLVEGAIYDFVGATLGAVVAFVTARHVARGPVERLVAREPRLASIDRAVRAEGRRIVFLLRLSPFFPFGLINYALGLTTVRFRDYLVASVGMLPGSLLYVYSGKIAGDVAMVAAGGPLTETRAHYALAAVGLGSTLVVTAVVSRIARRALRESTGEG
jgi:uncharacterized membrane protein YdjX (TVP38/TMEM64 family)